MAGYSRSPKVFDQESQLKDIRRQLADQLGCIDFRMESKLSLLAEFQEFFKRRGEVEYEYARSIERLCEKFERNTKQRNLRNEVRSTFNLWSTLLAETRKVSRERASLAEAMASEMVARLDIMTKDVHMLTKKCKDICMEIQDQYLKELRDLSEQTKVYQHSCYNTTEAFSKVAKCKEKVDAIKGASARRKKAEEKLIEKQKQFKIQKHLLLKNRNDYLLGLTRCNALSTQYFSMDIMDIIEYMDFDYHNSFKRLIVAYKDVEKDTCEAMMQSGEVLVDQTVSLKFENDLHYFLSEYSTPFTSPNYFEYIPFEGDDVSTFKVNSEDVFKRWSKSMADLREEIQTLQIQREEDVKTIEHIKQVNLKKYQITSVEDALGVIEDNGDSIGLDTSRGNASLERGLSLTTRGGQAITMSQKGKKDTLNFVLQISQRRILRADRLAVASAQLDVLENAFEEQKVPPVPVGVDPQGRTIPGEVPKLFGGEIVKYILTTGCEIPLIVKSCVGAIEECGMKMEGLFRVPGPAAVLEELRMAFEEGRDPLANCSQNKLDVAAVASTLKAYFRELVVPLFPTDKYQDFINCTRLEDAQSRLDALSATIQTLPSQVIPVMRFLFRFLYRVSLHSLENKMGSANLALVFGPTLTRAPDSLDPRQLHNDVPSINILIQMCIEGHEYIFGEDKDDKPVILSSPNDDEEQKVPPLSTSPPTEPPSAPPTTLESPLVYPQHLPEAYDEEVCKLPPPPYPPRASEENPLLSANVPPPPRPPKPQAVSPPPPPPEEECEESADQISDTLPEMERTHQSSGMDLSSLDAKMQEIEDSIHEMDQTESITASTAIPVLSPAEDEGKEEEEEEEDSDSEDEDEGDGLRIGARALYDYAARSDKELSFSRGDSLQVITKTPDNNWWDGFYSGRRGFIPVAYVEITELKTSPLPEETVIPTSPSSVPVPPERKSTSAPSALPVPAPPERKSSMPNPELEHKWSVPPLHEPSILEEEGLPPDPQDDVSDTPTPVSPLLILSKSEGEVEGEAELKPGTDATVPIKSVKSLTMQFQEPEPSQQKVLVEPHTHRRHASDVHHKATSEHITQPIPHPRSASGGSKVSMISSTFEKSSVPSGPPPPTRPKPIIPPPLSPGSGGESSVFPLVAHGSGSLPSVSPLQRAVQQSQQIGQKPPVSGKKPIPPAAGKSIAKVKGGIKKKDSLKEKDRGSKPPPNPKPPTGFVASPAEIKAELQARAKRKKSDDPLK